MRKSILLTGLIAVIAVTLALGLTQTDKGKEWFSVYSKPRQTTTDATTVASTTTPPAATPAPAPTADTTAAAMPATAPATPTAPTADATSSSAMTPVNLDAAQAKLNAEAPASGSDKPADTTAPKTTFKPDVAAALQDISIGSNDAPLTIYDFSSLSCPHCGHFHNDVLPQIKKNYIDTGKVRWVFKGFPLNDPALKAEMIARCVPKDQYLKMIDLMYANQERWAFSASPIPNLSMLVKLAGVTDDMFLGCVNSKELQDGLLKKIQADSDKYKLNSTPTFIINDGEKKIEGAGSYEGFAFDLDALLKAKEAAKATPAATTTK